MTPSWRKPFGVFAIVGLIAAWTMLCATLIDELDAHVLVQLPLYVLAGVIWLWLFPLKRMLLWMETGRWRG